MTERTLTATFTLDTSRFKAAMEQAQRVARRAQLAAWRQALARERREHDTSLAAASGLTEDPA